MKRFIESVSNTCDSHVKQALLSPLKSQCTFSMCLFHYTITGIGNYHGYWKQTLVFSV